MLSEEEKKAIERLSNGEKIELISLIRIFKREGIEKFAVVRKEYLDTVLSLIKEQQEEIEKLKENNSNVWQLNANMSKRHLNDIFKLQKKDKQIDLMAQCIDKELSSARLGELLNKNVNPLETYKEDIKQYFERKVEDVKD